VAQAFAAFCQNPSSLYSGKPNIGNKTMQKHVKNKLGVQLGGQLGGQKTKKTSVFNWG
jgi:hypothetical protein